MAEVETGAAVEVQAGGEERSLTEVEHLAKEMGWDPDHQSKAGRQPRTAQDWIRSTNANNRNLRREVDDLKGSIDRIASVADKQVRREVEATTREIEERFAAAVDAKDTKGAAKAVHDLRALEDDARPAKGEDPEARFTRENPWYGKDEDATALAVVVSSREAKKGASPEAQLKAAAAAVRKTFPNLYEADAEAEADGEAEAEPAPKRQPTLHAPSRSIGRRTQAYADMPVAARSAADRFYEAAKMRSTAPADRKAFDAQYARDYFAEQTA